MRRPLWRGVGRLGVAVAIVLVVVAAASAAIGLLAHMEVRRAVSLGMYFAGALLLTFGFFHGVRPPVRVEGERGHSGMFGVLLSRGYVRGASADELRDAHASSALFIGLGLVLVLVGALLDPSHRVL